MKNYTVVLGVVVCVVTIITAQHIVRAFKIEPTVQNTEKPITIVIPSFNNKDWYQKNLDSVWQQQYSNFRVMYVDDNSPDGTAQLVEQYIATHPHQFKIELIKNSARRGALANLYYAIHSCKDDEIIITLDGDDWFAHPHVLATINHAYQQSPILLTYGQYVTSHSAHMGMCRRYPIAVVEHNKYRAYPWLASHLRSFYAGLFKKIKKEDLMFEDNFFMVTWDQAIMYPMLEMAAGRYQCISDVLYIYNDENPINDWKVRLNLMARAEQVIRHRPAYEPLPADTAFVTA